jgi:hypothetical protein
MVPPLLPPAGRDVAAAAFRAVVHSDALLISGAAG